MVYECICLTSFAKIHAELRIKYILSEAYIYCNLLVHPTICNFMKDLQLAIVQFMPKWEDKTYNLSQVESFLRQIPHSVHVVVFPEMFTTGFSMNAPSLAESMDGPTIQALSQWSLQYRKIIVGSVIIEEDNHYYNRLIWMQPNGKYYTYDKAHLFAKAGEDKVYSKGSQKLIVSVNGWRVLLQTCYDLRFPVWARQTEILYDLMINVAHWPSVRTKAWDALLLARAIENQAFVIGCNACGNDGKGFLYSGHSQAIDCEGNILWKSDKQNDIGIVTLKKEPLNNFRQSHNFLAQRDRFIILD